MKSVLPVKMLSALALVLLVFSATEGRILSKCELKTELEAAQIQLTEAMGDKMTVDDLIARLVCKANSSAFNTSSVKAIRVNDKENKPAQAPPLAKSGSPRKPHAQDPTKGPQGSGHEIKPHAQDPTKGPQGSGHEIKPHAQAPTKGLQGSGHVTKPPHLNVSAKVFGQLYGLFQLSDQLACDSGMNASLNVCNMSCSALTDDDISNDIVCLKTLMNSILETLMVKECHSVVPSKYFADCA
ncbi:uncharacterized protein LOC143753519 [Siphateles boraxobius]|uniref:uncharacterized protein LOC143753519 n=1 Tax=Siphateles boraxobius TaxID=180520 RepID=UPI004063703F